MSGEYSIEKNVPMPNGSTNPRRTILQTLAKMEIGDSVGGLTEREARNFQNSVGQHQKHSPDPHKVSIRRQDDGSYRVWRVA